VAAPPVVAESAYRPGRVSQPCTVASPQVIGPQSRALAWARPMTSSTSAASSGPGRLIPTVFISGLVTADSARAGSTTSCRCPAISQPSDR